VYVRKREKRERLLPDCPGTKKETLFSVPTWPTREKQRGEKKDERRRRVLRKGMGKLLGTVQKKSEIV